MEQQRPKGIFAKGGSKKWWAKIKTPTGWKNVPTPYRPADDPEGKDAAAFRAKFQEGIDSGKPVAPSGPMTVKQWGEHWYAEYRKGKLASAADDESRLRIHIYPRIGSTPIRSVQPKDIANIIQAAKDGGAAPRTIRNIYSTLRAMCRKAMLDPDRTGVRVSPCILDRAELGTIKDRDPEWRQTAIFRQEELSLLLGDRRVPQDRQVMYGLLGLGCLRHGEAAGLRWRHVEKAEPLSRLLIATSYDTGSTKTGCTRAMPIHPVLAAMLAEWRLSGWAREFGRAPGPDDRVVPHTRPTNRGLQVKFEGMRADQDSYKRLHIDCAALGLRPRRTHDLRRSGITLYREAGADKGILRYGTHGSAEDIMDVYSSFRWTKLCAQVSVLKIERGSAQVAG